MNISKLFVVFGPESAKEFTGNETWSILSGPDEYGISGMTLMVVADDTEDALGKAHDYWEGPGPVLKFPEVLY